jgi:hypothetical protein
MIEERCELCEKSDDPHSQSKYGFQLRNRVVHGAPRRLLCVNCISYLKNHKGIDFEEAKLKRSRRKARLAASRPYIGQCEICDITEITVKNSTFHQGKYRKSVCEACKAHIYAHPEMSFEELRANRVWRSAIIKKYRHSKFAIIPKKDRVYTKINGVWNSEKYECKKCGEMKIIRNPKYHLCTSCTKHEEFIGETCECCYRVSDGTYGMTRIYTSSADEQKTAELFCMNCYAKMLRFSIEKEQLRELMEVENCQVCDIELMPGKIGGNARCIDHDHETGKVRGVLCSNCNKVEGYINNMSEDPIAWIGKLQAYLEGPPSD